MPEYTKVDLENQTVDAATAVSAGITAYSGVGTVQTTLISKKMNQFASCLVSQGVGSVKAFYSVSQKSVGIIGVGASNAKTITICAVGALASTLSISPCTNGDPVYACYTAYSAKSPSGTEYYVGIMGIGTNADVCSKLCSASINGCPKYESIFLGCA
jgi:hypothetical protein